jgi:hypothetical protein
MDRGVRLLADLLGPVLGVGLVVPQARHEAVGRPVQPDDRPARCTGPADGVLRRGRVLEHHLRQDLPRLGRTVRLHPDRRARRVHVRRSPAVAARPAGRCRRQGPRSRYCHLCDHHRSRGRAVEGRADHRAQSPGTDPHRHRRDRRGVRGAPCLPALLQPAAGRQVRWPVQRLPRPAGLLQRTGRQDQGAHPEEPVRVRVGAQPRPGPPGRSHRQGDRLRRQRPARPQPQQRLQEGLRQRRGCRKEDRLGQGRVRCSSSSLRC